MDRLGTGIRGGGLGPLGGGTMGPPGTAMRPPTGLRQPMGTAMGARMGTAMRPGSRAGLGPLNTNIQVAERPVTQQGMMGMKPISQGPGRQIQDRSYYMGELRKRCDELQAEINKMNGEAEQYNKDNETYTRFEKKYNTLIGEVRTLQGDLADLNLIADKSRNNTDPQDIDNNFQYLKQQNEERTQRCDAILLQRKHTEMETEELERKIREFQQAEKEKLSHLSPDLQRRYGELQDDRKRLLADEDTRRRFFDDLCSQLGEKEEQLKADGKKQRLIQLQSKKNALKERVSKLEAEVNKPVLSEAEMREQLLEQIKKDKEETAFYERESQALEQRIKQAEEELEKLDSGGPAADAEDAKKYQKLQEKDQEMSDFIAKHDDTMLKERDAIKETERRIVQLLEHISKDLGRSHQLPSKEGYLDMKNEVAMKQRGLDNSQTTAERLKSEQTMRQAELDKIENLDQKISIELKTLNDRRETMTEELKKFGNISQLREDAEQNKTNMMARKQRLDRMRKALKLQVQLLSTEFDKQKQALATSESAGTLEALEQKLKHHEQNIYHLRDFIDSKYAETDYSGVYEEVSRQVADINTMLQQLYSTPY